MRIKTIQTSNKNFILKYFRCRDGKRTETRIGMEGICITHSCIPLYTVYMQHIMAHSGGMQEWVIQIPSIPILVSVLFPSLHLKYFRIKFLLLVIFVSMPIVMSMHGIVYALSIEAVCALFNVQHVLLITHMHSF